MTTKEFLLLYRWTEREIEELTEQLQILRSKAEQITPVYGGNKGGSSGGAQNADKIPVLVGKIINEEHRVEERAEELFEIRREIGKAINAVPNDALRNLLLMRYIGGKTWEEISVLMHYSYVHVVHRLHPQALKSVKIPEKYGNM